MSQNPHVVIVGRPNVGKSTLFNRLVGYRRALVHDEPGVTRDRLVLKAKWHLHGKQFEPILVDTGGLGGERFAEEIQRQVDMALEDARCVVIVFDGQAGLTPADEELVQNMIRAGVMKRCQVIGVVNKVDAHQHESFLNDFYSLGFDHWLTVSAEHGRGIDDLKLQIGEALGFDLTPAQATEEGFEESEQEELTEEDDEEQSDDQDVEQDEDSEEEQEEVRERRVPRIAIVGRPNVGKSTLVNALLGERRMITSPIAGTTVDSIDSVVEMNGKPYVVIDTAGIRRKSKTEQGVEVLSIVQSMKALENADLAILVIDGESGSTDQDEKIGGMIEDAGVSVIIAVNKWDTQRGNKDFSKEDAAERIRKKFGFLQYAPLLFMSALRRQGLNGLGDLIDEILHQRQLKLPTHEFTEWVRHESTIHNPQNAKFYLAHQSGRHPPTFVVHVNDPNRVHFSLRRHMVNALRERWGFMGSPVRLLFVEGKNRRSLPKKRGQARSKPTSSATK